MSLCSEGLCGVARSLIPGWRMRHTPGYVSGVNSLAGWGHDHLDGEGAVGTDYTGCRQRVRATDACLGVMAGNRCFRLMLIVAVSGCAPESNPSALDTRMVDAGGHRLEMVFQGRGTPAVVFDAGMIGGMHNWNIVRDSVALHTETVIFERAGFGNSEEGPSPRTAQRLATELHTALQNAGIGFPVVLVGHSAGGLFSRVFAATYSRDVTGLILVDASTEEVYDYMRDSDPGRWDSYVDEVRELYEMPPGWFGQWEALPVSLAQARKSWPLPEVPTVVLSAFTAVGEWPLESEQDMEVWERSQLALAERIPDAEHVILQHAHHMSILEEAVLREKILEVVDRATRR